MGTEIGRKRCFHSLFSLPHMPVGKAISYSLMNKARVLNIPKDKILETFKIARFAQATHVMGNAEKVFQHLKDEW